MIPREVANRFADRMGVDLHIAQQEVVLLYCLDALAAAGVADRLVFKGGTYLRLMVTGDAGRLSEDLDFTNAGLPEDPQSLLEAAFAAPHHGVRFAVREWPDLERLIGRARRRNWNREAAEAAKRFAFLRTSRRSSSICSRTRGPSTGVPASGGAGGVPFVRGELGPSLGAVRVALGRGWDPPLT